MTLDSFAFTMQSLNPIFYGFLGGSDDGFHKYAVYKDSVAYFNDSNAYEDGFPLYYEDEEPCELLFRIKDKNTLLVGENNCYMIYGGAGTIWEGVYRRLLIKNDILDFKGIELAGVF